MMTKTNDLGRTRIALLAAAMALLPLLAVALLISPFPALAQSEAPATPSSVTITRADGTVTASWPAVSGATKYHVTYSSDNGQSWTAASGGHPTNTITISGAANGKTYIVGVRAGNDAGQWSGWRNSAPSGPYTPPAPTPSPNPPGRPTSVTVTRGDGTVTADWPDVSGATKHHVTYSVDNGQSWSLATSERPDSDVTINGADNSKTYIVGVRAGNDAGWSGWRNSAPAGPYTPEPTPTPTPTPAPQIAPDAPASVTLTRDDGTVTASWPAASGATKYHVTYSSDDKRNWNAAAGSHTETSITISGADNDKTYYVGVRAGNDAGWSGWRNSEAAGPYKAPGIIVQDSSGNAITGLSISEGGEASYQVKLASQPEQDVKVRVGLSVRDNNDADITFKGEASDVAAIKLTFTPSNWNTGQTVTLAAAEDDDSANGARDAIHDAREGEYLYFTGNVSLAVTEVDNDDPPAAPSSVSVTRSDGAIIASWPAVSEATGYAVAYSAVGSGDWVTAASNQAGNSITISGVNNDHTYLVSASSRNKYGESNPSVSPAAGPYSKRPPATPLSVTVLRADGELTAFWNSGFGAESYHVTYTSDNGKNWSGAASDLPVGNGTTDITIKDLDNSKTYTVAVRARNKNGYSGWRNSSPSGPYVAIVAPPKPKNAVVYPSDKAATFIWDKPVDLGDAEVTGYQAAYWLNPGACGWPDTVQWYNIHGSNGDTVYHTVIGHHTENGERKPGLKNGVRYGVGLRAVNQGVPGPGVGTCLFPIAGVNPPSFVPPAPKSLNVIRGDGKITVTWHPSWSATGYQVDYKTYGSKDWKMAAWWNATTSIILNGTDNNTAYAVRVRGRNDRGDGPWRYMPVSVSNLGETKSGTSVVGKDSWAHTSQAAGFAVGANSNGYTLQSVTVKMADTVGSPTGLTVAIHASSGGNPAASATYTLSGDVPTSAGEYTYSCDGTCSLGAGAEYFLVLSATVPATGENYYRTERTISDNETNEPANAGWSIANVIKYSDDGGAWTDSLSSSTLLFKVAATVK